MIKDMRTVTIASCRKCGHEKKISGRGLCTACYMHHWELGTLDEFPILPREPKPISTEKPCAICKTVKPLEEFPRNRRKHDGRHYYCTPCVREKYGVPARERKRKVARPTEGELQCGDCGQTKSVSEFYWRSDAGRFQSYCKTCKSRRDKTYRDADPLAHRDRVMRRKYGIGLAEFDAMVAAQGGGCAICKATVNPDANSLAVDHCHKTGKVRGILCGRCNKALGLFNDDPNLLKRAVMYLRR